MEDHPERFEVLPVGEMRRRYYSPHEKPPELRLNAEGVPEPLRPLIPIAEKWGISDDILRHDFVQKAAPGDLAELKRLVAANDDLLDAWLAGPEADGPVLSQEYLAFTHMRMAADGI